MSTDEAKVASSGAGAGAGAGASAAVTDIGTVGTLVAGDSPGATAEERAASYAQYREWATDVLGVRLHYGLRLQDLPAPYQRGLVVEDFVPSGKDLISVPISAMITVELLDDPSHPVRRRAAAALRMLICGV